MKESGGNRRHESNGISEWRNGMSMAASALKWQ
jgi:hypothetical protein